MFTTQCVIISDQSAGLSVLFGCLARASLDHPVGYSVCELGEAKCPIVNECDVLSLTVCPGDCPEFTLPQVQTIGE